jgi:hypothetical protein
MSFNDDIHTITYFVKQRSLTKLMLKEMVSLHFAVVYEIFKRKSKLHEANKEKLFIYKKLKNKNKDSIDLYLKKPDIIKI